MIKVERLPNFEEGIWCQFKGVNATKDYRQF